jgi:hypothetical protein
MADTITQGNSGISFIVNKLHLIIPIIFLIFTAVVAFMIDNPSHDNDLLYYYFSGSEILYGDKENVAVTNAPVGWPILLASVDSLINDVFITGKIFSVLSAAGIVLLSYYIINQVFGKKIALLTQTLIAINPFLHSEAIITHNEMLPVFLIFGALYFITKKHLLYQHIVCTAILLGLSFMLRYQSLLVSIGIMIFLLITLKSNSKIFPILFVVVLLLSTSPLLLYNLENTGNLIDSDYSVYMQMESKYKIPEIENAVIDQFRNVPNNELIQSEPLLKNYLYNVLIHNPHRIFNLGLGWDSFAPIPLIPYIGIPFILGGAIYVFNNNFTKRQLVSVVSISFGLILFLVTVDKLEYFFVAISLPVIVLGILSLRKIEKNILALLIIFSSFLLLISIIPINAPWDLFSILIIPPALSAIFIIKSIPKIISKIGSLLNHKTTRIIKTYLIILISIIVISNILFSIMLERSLLFDENMDYKNILYPEKHEKIGAKFKEVGDILSKEPDIQNKYIITGDPTYAYLAGSKMIYSKFTEGNENDSISSFITQENWSEFEKGWSDAVSIPRDRFGKYNPLPDYIVYDQRSVNNKLQILYEPNNPNIPSNLELLYISNSSKVVIYKINNTDE